MARVVRIFAALLVFSALGCLKPQSENPGAQTPASRATPPETGNYMATDSPFNDRAAAAQPAKPEHPDTK